MMFQPPLIEAGSIVNGRYRVVRVVGQGGMGVVYEAEDTRLNSTVALKQTLVHGEQLDQAFEREARLLARLRHGSLPKVMDYFTSEQGQFLVMEFIGGEDLATLETAQQQPFAIHNVIRWAFQLLDVLEYLHTQRPPIIHRDIKPQNLKLTERNDIILLDFGLAKNTDQSVSQATANRSLFGYTPQYSPPEQIHSAGTDVRSDIYALGATMYFLIVGVPPASALTRTVAFTNDAPDPLKPPHELRADVSPDISNVIMRAMSLKSAQRYANVTLMRDALRAAEAHTTQPLPNNDRTLVGGDSSAAPTIGGRTAPTVVTNVPQPALEAQGSSARRSLTLPITAGIVGVLVVIAIVGVVIALGGPSSGATPTAVAEATLQPTSEPAAQTDPTGTRALAADSSPTDATEPTVETGEPSAEAPTAETTEPAATDETTALSDADLQATTTAFYDGRNPIVNEATDRVAHQTTLQNAVAQYDSGTEGKLLERGYTNNIIGPQGQRGLRTNAVSKDGSLWVRDVDYTISGYGYALADLSVFRETLKQFLDKVDPDGEVPETVFAGSNKKINSGAWDSAPNLIHGVYVYVAKTGDYDFYRANRDAVLRAGQWIVALDTDGDGLPDDNPRFVYGYYNSVSNNVRHTYAIAKFYGAFLELAELEQSVSENGEPWAMHADTLRNAFHADGSPYWGNNPWPVAWLRADGTPVETLETFGVFEALQTGLIGPDYGDRYVNLMMALYDRFPELTSNGAPMRLALGGYPEDVLRTQPKVPIWMLDASASWIVGTAAPAYARANHTSEAQRLIQAYTNRAQTGKVAQFVAGSAAQFGPGQSDAYDLPWDDSAWFMAIYGGHYGLKITPTALIIAPNPFTQISGDGITGLSYQGGILNLSLDATQKSYRISVDRPTAVILRPMSGGSAVRIDDGPAVAEAPLIVQPNHEYVVVTVP